MSNIVCDAMCPLQRCLVLFDCLHPEFCIDIARVNQLTECLRIRLLCSSQFDKLAFTHAKQPHEERAEIHDRSLLMP